MDLNNKIVIIEDSKKNYLLNQIEKLDNLLNVKIITLSELKNKYLFSYDKKAIIYVKNKLNITYELASIYLENMYFLKDVSNKTNNLLKLKNELIDNNLLYFDNEFINFLKNKDIILYDLDNIDNFYNNIISILKENNNVEYYSYNKNFLKHNLYIVNDLNDEISLVCEEISKLLQKNIDINNIKICGINSDNYFEFNRIFKLFNLPLENIQTSAKGSYIISEFKNNFNNDINITIDIIKPLIKSKNDEYLYNKIIEAINNYYFINNFNEVKECIFDDLDKINIKKINYKNYISICDFEKEIFNEEDYVFLVNFNEGFFPNTYKDEDFISDKEKSKLNLSTSYEKNELLKNKIINNFNRTKNLMCFSIKKYENQECFLSSLFDENLFEIKIGKLSYEYSDLYNKEKLVILKDNYRLFGSLSDDLTFLAKHYNADKYLSFNNSYSKIDNDSLLEFINNKLSLSYSSINSFYKCSFKYYLEYILRLNKYEDTFDTIIGNIFHKVLSECFTNNYDLHKRYNEIVSSYDYEYSNSERFFIKNFEMYLERVIETIKNQYEYTDLNNYFYEKEIIIPISDNVTFKGYIDKIMYKDNIAQIIDYKTGNAEFDKKKFIYGLDLQLPSYVYLLKKSNLIEDVIIGGFYLQRLFEKDFDIRLDGFSNLNEQVLYHVDNNYENSLIIKGLKKSQNGFYAYSKIMSNNEINEISNLVENKVIKASEDILSSSFDINPKEINGDNIGCKYCKFKDICFMKMKDIVSLKKEGD